MGLECGTIGADEEYVGVSTCSKYTRKESACSHKVYDSWRTEQVLVRGPRKVA